LPQPWAPPAVQRREFAQLVAHLHRRVRGLLKSRGLLKDDDHERQPDHTAQDDAQLMLACANASPSQRVVERAPRKPARRSRYARRTALKASHSGFELHAEVVVDAYDQERLERMCRYLARPPVPADRVHLRRDGKVVFRLKRAFKNGVSELVFEPLAFLARLAALVPPPGFHLTRYFGLFSSGSLYRSLVVPVPAPKDDPDRPVAPKRPKSMGWSDLIRRVFLFDVLACDCGGRYRYVATIHDPDVVQTIPAAMALRETSRAPPTTPPPTVPPIVLPPRQVAA
jgi:hypothetical protein